MSIMRSKDGSELIATCSCGCEESIYLKIDPNDDSFCFLAYMNGKFYSEQGRSAYFYQEKNKENYGYIV